jgi:hypothetical protein
LWTLFSSKFCIPSISDWLSACVFQWVSFINSVVGEKCCNGVCKLVQILYLPNRSTTTFAHYQTSRHNGLEALGNRFVMPVIVLFQLMITPVRMLETWLRYGSLLIPFYRNHALSPEKEITLSGFDRVRHPELSKHFIWNDCHKLISYFAPTYLN